MTGKTRESLNELEIISAEVCPFAQRSLIALLEKGVSCRHTEIDLRNKPDWFADVSPYSKVPVLRHGDVRVYETRNTGIAYDIGFYVAIISGFGSLSLTRRKKKK